MKLLFVLILSLSLGTYYLFYEPQSANHTAYAKSVARRLVILKRAATDWVEQESSRPSDLNLTRVLAHFCGLEQENLSASFEKYLRPADCPLAGYKEGNYQDNEVYAQIKDGHLTVMTGEALCSHNLVEAVYQETKRLSKNPATLSITHEPNSYSSCGQVKFQLQVQN